MNTIRVDEALWASSIDPEGILERWFVRDGDHAAAGQKVAEVLIEGARHEIFAPTAGILVCRSDAGALVEPGDLIGELR
jgi:pyruvate/2-oxoglutarate dehydrogenase complex dihydrolipoamide acyltransferase (E2) component